MRRLASVPASIALAAMNAPPLHAYLERRYAARIEPDTGCPGLPAAEASVVETLRRDGVAVSHLDLLELTVQDGFDVVRCGQLLAAELARRVGAMGDRVPIMAMTEPADILANPEIYRWGLNPSLLRIAGAYLQRPVAYDGPILFHTPADGIEAGTRMWHLDREDRHVIKVALYLHDVDEECGPFQSLKRDVRSSTSKFHYEALDTAHLRRSFGCAGTSQILTCVGRTGTLVFADTARFYHRGMPARRKPRSALFYSYFAQPPRHPFFCNHSRLRRREIAALVRDMPPPPREAALWRDRLPRIARLVPTSPL